MIKGEVGLKATYLRTPSTDYRNIHWADFPYKWEVCRQMTDDMRLLINTGLGDLGVLKYSKFDWGTFRFYYVKYTTVRITVISLQGDNVNMVLEVTKKTIDKLVPEDPTEEEWDQQPLPPHHPTFYNICSKFDFIPIPAGNDRGIFVYMQNDQFGYADFAFYEEFIYPIVRKIIDAMYLRILEIRDLYTVMILKPNAYQHDNPLSLSTFQQYGARLKIITAHHRESVVNLSRLYQGEAVLDGALPEPTLLDVFYALLYDISSNNPVGFLA